MARDSRSQVEPLSETQKEEIATLRVEYLKGRGSPLIACIPVKPENWKRNGGRHKHTIKGACLFEFLRLAWKV